MALESFFKKGVLVTVVSLNWLKDCFKEQRFVPEVNYLVSKNHYSDAFKKKKNNIIPLKENDHEIESKKPSFKSKNEEFLDFSNSEPFFHCLKEETEFDGDKSWFAVESLDRKPVTHLPQTEAKDLCKKTGLFSALSFGIRGFSKDRIKTISKVILDASGSIKIPYDYCIVPFKNGLKGSKNVTELWVEACIEEQKILEPTKLTFKPLDTRDISNLFHGKRFGITGYEGYERGTKKQL